MNYISEQVLNETVAEMKQAVADHLEFCGAGHRPKSERHRGVDIEQGIR